MQKKFLEFIAFITTYKPRLLLIIVSIISVLCIIMLFNIKIETDVSSLLPEHSEVAQVFQKSLEDFGAFDFMLIVVESDKERDEKFIVSASEKFSKYIQNKNLIQSITYRLDPELQSIIKNESAKWIVSILTPEDFINIKEILTPAEIAKRIKQFKARLVAVQSQKAKDLLLQDPFDLSLVIRKRLMQSYGPTKLNLTKGYFISNDSKMQLIVIKPAVSSADIAFAQNLVDFLKESKEQFFKENPEIAKHIKISFAGSHIEALNDTLLVRRDFKSTMISSFFVVMLLFVVIYKRWDSTIFVGIPLIIGILLTSGIIYIFIGRLTVMTVAFGAILIGLGIDFAIHIYGRFTEEMLKEHDSVKAVKIALTETGGGIIAGALTTAFAFYGMFFTSFKGFKELGFITGSGILACMISIFITLPSILIIRTAREKGKIQEKHYRPFYLDKLSDFIEKYPKFIVYSIVLITIFLGYFAVRIKFEEDLRKLKQPSEFYVELKKRLSKSFEMPSNQIISITSGKTFQEALEKNDALYCNIMRNKGEYPILTVDSLRAFLPSIKSQKAAREFILSIDENELKNEIFKNAGELKLSENAFAPFLKRLTEMKEYAKNGEYIEVDKINSELFKESIEKYVAKTDEGFKIASHIYPQAGYWRNSVPKEFLNTISKDAGDVKFTGVAIVSEALRDLIKEDFEIVVAIVLSIVFSLILIHFKNIKLSVISIFPVIIGSIWLLGAMVLLNIKLNAVNIVVIPMIIGIGVDNGIHLIHRYYENKICSIRNAIEHTGRSMIMCSLTTICGFGSLSSANFKGIREMGQMSILGVGFCLITAMTLVPAILKIMQRNKNK